MALGGRHSFPIRSTSATKTISKNIQSTGRSARDVFLPKYCLNSVPIVALLKSQFWGPWGSMLAPSGSLWLHFVAVGPPLGPFGDGIDFRTFSGGSWHPFGVPFWHLKSQKVIKNTKKRCPESGAEKKCSRSSPESAQCVICIVKTICLVRSKGRHFGDFWSPFGSLLGSLLVTFCKKLRFGGIKKQIKKKVRKSMKNGSGGNPANGL